MGNHQSALPTCAICMEGVPLEEAVHPHNPPVGGGCLYHENCLRLWLARGNNTCPTCRRRSTGPVRNPIFSRCADFRAFARRQLERLALVVLASSVALGVLLVIVPASRTVIVVGQNAGLEVRCGRLLRVLRPRAPRCRAVEAAMHPLAARPDRAFDLVSVAMASITCATLCGLVVYKGRRFGQEFNSALVSMAQDLNQLVSGLVFGERANGRREANNAGRVAIHRAVQAAVAASEAQAEEELRELTEQHRLDLATARSISDAAGPEIEAARAEADRLRSRLQTLEPQLKTSRAEVEGLTARVKEEAAAKDTAEANARREAVARAAAEARAAETEAARAAAEARVAETEAARAAAEATARRQAAAATMANAARRQAAAADAQAAETESRAELLARDEAARREAEQAAAARAVATASAAERRRAFLAEPLTARDEAVRRERERAARAAAADRHSVGDQGVEKAKSETPNNVRRVSFDETERNSVVRSTPVEGETSRASSPKPKKRSWYSRVRDVVFAPPTYYSGSTSTYDPYDDGPTIYGI